MIADPKTAFAPEAHQPDDPGVASGGTYGDAWMLRDPRIAVLCRAVSGLAARQDGIAARIEAELRTIGEAVAAQNRGPKEHMTTKEAARYMGRSISWLLRQKDIPYYPGRPNMYKRDDLDEWRDENVRREPLIG